MMRTPALGLLLVLSAPLLFKTGVLVWYAWNKKEIIARECINRSRPRVRCNGKCYLAKQLKKVDQPESPQKPVQPVKVREKSEMPSFIPPGKPGMVVAQTTEHEFYRQAFAPEQIPEQLVLRQVFKPPA